MTLIRDRCEHCGHPPFTHRPYGAGDYAPCDYEDCACSNYTPTTRRAPLRERGGPR